MECDEYFLPLFDVVSGFSLDLMRELLPRALVGLIGLVPMSKAVKAILNFFNSSACQGKVLQKVAIDINHVILSSL